MRLHPVLLLAVSAGAVLAPSALAADTRVDFRSNEYLQKDVTIVAGEAITWAPVVGTSFDAHPLAPAAGQGEAFKQTTGTQPYSYTFATPGEYLYYCEFHGFAEGSGANAKLTGMAGRVRVVAAGGATGPTGPADPAPPPAPAGPAGPSGMPAPTGPEAESAPAAARLTLGVRLGAPLTARALRGNGFAILATPSRQAEVRATLSLDGRVIARAPARTVPRGATRRLVIRRTAKATLRRGRQLRLTVVATRGAERVTVRRLVRAR